MEMTNQKELIQQLKKELTPLLKKINDKMDSIIAQLQVKQEETWVTGRYLIAMLGIDHHALRRMRRSGVVKCKGAGTGKKYLLQSIPEHMTKKKGAGDKSNL